MKAKPLRSGTLRRLRAGVRPRVADLGLPVVYDRQVAALRIGRAPLHLLRWDTNCTREEPLAILRMRASSHSGRISLLDSDGSEHELLVLGRNEAVNLHLGDVWPPRQQNHMSSYEGHRSLRGTGRQGFGSAAIGAFRDIGEAVSFPYWFGRAVRTQAERSQQVHELATVLRDSCPQATLYYE